MSEEPTSLQPDGAPSLADAQGRRLTYLRLSVTDRCNYRCSYCSPGSWAGRAQLLDEEEVVRVATLFARMGVRKVRLTGGEPLLRKDLPSIVRRIRALPGIHEVCLTTNGHLLAESAKELKAAGLDRVNLSVDTLDPEKFKKITGGHGDVGRLVAGVEAARAAGFADLRVNTVVVDGFNDGEAASIVRWAWERDIVPRFIELMPFAANGQPVSTLDLIARLKAQGLELTQDLVAPDASSGPSEYWRGEGGRKVGFIGPLTRNFCERCNRVRIAANGNLHACLGGSTSLPLAPLLRSKATDAEIEARIREALASKPDGHCMTSPDAKAHLAAMMGIGG
ncbi:MAG TPA: GTP 3',8-cyclase MoaA [Myxococcales bacterium]